jgi:hypothetical protein
MGVADNRSYKDEYLFHDDRTYNIREEQPSIAEDPKINTTIKENPYRSNVEIEGDEIVLQPDLSALFKAKGQKHSKGGMDVLLKPESFIFSDWKGLAFTKEDYELMELKEASKKTDPNKNTPAEVLKKNVDIEHYNKLVTILDDPYKDDLAKKSAAMMLEKYLQNLGNIAYVQEEKKGFPSGMPAFSMGTAPVYDPTVKTDIDESKQYMRAGGTTKNPYAEGGSAFVPDRCPCGKDAQGNCLPCTPAQIAELSKRAVKGTLKDVTGMTKVGSVNNTDIYHTGTDPRAAQRQTPGPKMSNENWKKFLQTPQGQTWLKNYKSTVPGTDKLVGITNTPPPAYNPPPIPPAPPVVPGPAVPDLEVTPQGSKQADWRFTPWQKLSQLNQLGQYALTKRYMPYRSRYNATYVDPALVNPEQAVGDIKGIANQQLSSVGTLNPILRNAQAASISGQVMNQVPGVRAQYDNQNAQILNNTRQYNNQVKNNESLVNMGNDQQYYQQAIEGRKNFDNMRTYTWNNYMNNLMRDVETNQKLAYNLLTQNNPAYGFDWRTGNFTRNQKSILDVQGNAVNDRYQDLVSLVNNITDPVEKAKLMVKLEGLRTFGSAQQAPQFKKGGKTKKNPY